MEIKHEKIHGYSVDYDADSDILENAVDYLKNKLEQKEVNPWFITAKRDRYAYIQFRDPETRKDKDLTLYYEGNGVYELKKRS